jgi:hypothetical protein
MRAEIPPRPKASRFPFCVKMTQSPFGNIPNEESNEPLTIKSNMTRDMWLDSLEGSDDVFSPSFSASIEDVLTMDNPFIVQALVVNPKIIRGSDFDVHTPRRSEIDVKRDDLMGVLSVDDDTRKIFLDKLQSSTNKIKRDLLHDIAPLSLSFDMALTETLETLDLLLPDAGSSANFQKLSTIYRKAIELKFIDSVTNNLDIDHWKMTLLSLVEKRQPTTTNH